MFSATLFESEEKISRSNMVELLTNAKECVFTATFRKKIAASDIEDILSGVKNDK
jgi:hypothetical protein